MKLLLKNGNRWPKLSLIIMLALGNLNQGVAQDCGTSPVITCPPIYFGCTGDDLSPDALGYATAIPGDANCPQPIITYRDTTITNNICGTGREIKRFWKATYSGDINPWLFAECTQVLVLRDSEDPVIMNCPPDVVVGTDQSCRAIVHWDQPTASDDCGILGFTSNYGSGSAFYPGVTTVTYTATDNCGKRTTCSFTVTVQEACCNDTPSLNIPADYTGCPSSSVDPVVTGQASGSISGFGCGDPEITYQDIVTSDGDCPGETVIQRTWKAVNPNNPNSSSSGVQWITLIDNTTPTIMHCPTDITVVSNATCQAIVTWGVLTAQDNCGIQSFTSNYASGSSFPIGTTTVTYTAVDICGNVSVCSFDVIVQGNCCNGVPILTLPADFVGCPGTSSHPNQTGQASAYISGNGCQAPSITYSDFIINSGSCHQEIERTWTATNPNYPSQKSSGIQNLKFIDNQAPNILNCPADIVVSSDSNCSAIVTWTSPSVQDNCSIQSFSSNYQPGSSFPVGVTIVTYTAVDGCGNMAQCSFDVIVEGGCCNGAPILNLPPDFISCPDHPFDPSVAGQASAYISGSSCAAPMVTFSDITTNYDPCVRTIERTWTATNPNHPDQQTSGVQHITLSDTESPVILNCPADIIVDSNEDCFAIVNWMIPTVTDNCGISAFYNDRPTGSGSRFELGTTTITYTAEDVCGNKTQCSFNVIVNANCCSDAMIVYCPSDYIGCPNSSIHPDVTGHATSNQNSDCPATITYYDITSTTGPCPEGRVINRHWVATRNDGSAADTCIQLIKLTDTQAPVILLCPSDVTLDYDDRVYTWPEAMVSDDCSSHISYSIANGSTFSEGSTEVMVTIMDDCGHSTSCSFIVTIRPPANGTGLIVNCPEDIVIDCGNSAYGPVPVPTATSDCSLCPESDIPGFVYMGNYNGHNYYCSKDKMTWPDAEAFSASSGGHLAVINDADENYFLANLLEVNSAYIGLSDHVQEGVYAWVDGEPLSYSRWYPHQPNNYQGRQDYIELLHSGYWNDQYNDKKLEFIMEVSCIEVIQTSGPERLEEITQNSTVTFEIKDACGDSEICSYEIIVSSNISISCPQDIQVTGTGQESVIYYETPEFNSCCENCHPGDPIDGFVYMGQKDGSYYYCSKSKTTWHDANLIARQKGGHLAIIDDANENSYLAYLLGHQIAFIGISDHAEEGVWRNVNGHIQQYFNWRYDNPNNHEGVQHYVELEPSGKWNDNSGTYKREYIIEIKGCGRTRLTRGIPSGGYFPEGTTLLQYEGYDNCGNKSGCTFNVTVLNDPNIVHEYCKSFGKYSRRAHIKKVQIDNFSHVSGDNGGYYSHEPTCVDIDVLKGFKLSVTPGWSYYRYLAYYKIYVDFNGDGDFTDHGEYVGKSKSANVISGNIHVPPGSIEGYTRLRIVMSVTGYEDPCGSYYYGETEDYCLNLTGHITTNEVPKSSKNKEYMDPSSVFTELENTIGDKVNIFPNPTSDYFTLSNPDIISEVKIINMAGVVVKRLVLPSRNIDVSKLTSGIYFIEMTDDAGLPILEKLIVE